MIRKLSNACCLAVSIAVLGLATVPRPAAAQRLEQVEKPAEPLVLADRGSFFVDGRSVKQSPAELSSIFGRPLANDGHVTVDQMYVEYMVPAQRAGVPVVMLHGGTLTGKGFDTTPDGRMGWYEYFVRHGHPTYVADQISRGRSGVNIATYNDVRLGRKPVSALPNAFRESDEYNWKLFRMGPANGVTFPGSQFPSGAGAELSKQGVADFNPMLPSPNPNARAMADLARETGGAILMGHSEAGGIPIDAALTDPSGVRGIIEVEPGACDADKRTPAQIATLAHIPTLMVFGDHLDAATGTALDWTKVYADCNRLIGRINAVGGKASMLHPADLGIRGNTHLLMMDRNSLQIADLILAWINRNVPSSATPQNPDQRASVARESAQR